MQARPLLPDFFFAPVVFRRPEKETVLSVA